MRVIAFVNQKGGVGKTTTVHNVGAALAREGKRVLMVDLDAQGSLTASCGYEPDELEITVYDAMEGQTAMRDIIISLDGPSGFALAPAGINLAQADLAFSGRIGRENLLKKVLAQVEGFDFVLLDCPPNLGLVTLNALVAASEIIIPVQAQFHALRALELLQNTIKQVREINPGLRVSGILLTLFNKQKTLNRDVFNEVRKNFPELIFDTKIRDGVALAEAPAHGQDIFLYRAASAGSEDYKRLAEEIIGRG